MTGQPEVIPGSLHRADTSGLPTNRHKPFLFRSAIRVAKRRLAIQDLVSSR